MPSRRVADEWLRMHAIQDTNAVPQTAPTGARTGGMPVWVPLLLSLPAWIPLVWTATRAWLNGLVPTAFVHYDYPFYLASGRQYFADGFHLTYGSPYTAYGTPKIYFQFHLF